MSLKHLFWDFDGTLYDSYPKIAQAMSLALADFGVTASAAELLKPLKITVYHAICEYAKPAGLDPQAVMDAFHRYQSAEGFFPPYDGLGDCLRRLRDAGCKHYLYTHRDRFAIEQLKRDDLWDCFADAVTREDGYADKPAPDALLALMQRHDAKPSECAMIGDRDIDIGSGANAGMHTILFDPDGFYPALAADVRVADMRSLSDALQRWRG